MPVRYQKAFSADLLIIFMLFINIPMNYRHRKINKNQVLEKSYQQD